MTAFVIHPGWVQTDLGNLGATTMGVKEAPVTVKDSVEGMASIIERATKEEYGGMFWDYTGERLRW